jgi:hypothetical protein
MIRMSSNDFRAGHDRIQSYEQRLGVQGSEPSFNEDGVDLTLIRESLRRTPYERLILVQNWVESLQSVRVVRGPR